MGFARILEDFCAAGGISGREDAPARVFEKYISPYCKAERDGLGNVFAMLPGGGGARVMLEAHLDTIGFMAEHITECGFVLFSPVGGFDEKVLPAAEVTIHAKKPCAGIVSTLPPHIKKGDAPPPALSEMCIDTGLGKRARELISVGDAITVNGSFTPLLGGRAAGAAFDDRACLAVIIRVFDLLCGEDLDFNLYACATVREEVGLLGAGAAARRVKPDIAICLDAGHAESPDAPPSGRVFRLGGGPVITVGANVYPALSKGLKKTAEDYGLPYQTEAEGGSTGTNAWAVQAAGYGIPTALLSLPLRYMHTPQEVISLDDMENTALLLAAFLKQLKPEALPCC